LGQGRKDKVAWWNPQVGKENRETAGANCVLGMKIFFAPPPITLYRGSSLLHLLELL
jgi:hypothetical protein